MTNKPLKAAPAVLAGLLLASCATGPVFEAAPPAPSGRALIYIYREPGFAAAGLTANFYVDEVEVAELNNGGYTRIYAPAGSHELKQKWKPLPLGASAPMPSTHIDAEWTSGSTYYYNLKTGVGGMGPGRYGVVWQISGVDPATGGQEISRYHFQPPIGDPQN